MSSMAAASSVLFCATLRNTAPAFAPVMNPAALLQVQAGLPAQARYEELGTHACRHVTAL